MIMVERKKEIANLANELLKKYKMDESVPVDIVRLSSSLGMEIVHREYEDERISGGLKRNKKEDKFTVYLNLNNSLARRRFTLAHEIGHARLHVGLADEGFVEAIEMSRRENSYDDKELEADEFAANLLMPEATVKKLWKRFSNADILASLFDVSVPAMKYRLSKLGIY